MNQIDKLSNLAQKETEEKSRNINQRAGFNEECTTKVSIVTTYYTPIKTESGMKTIGELLGYDL